MTTIHQTYLERLTKFIAHNVVDQRIYAGTAIVQNSGGVSCKDEYISYERIIHILHRPHIRETLGVKRRPTKEKANHNGN